MLDQLQKYAQKSDPRRTIPSDVLVTNDEHTVTIFDLFPKGEVDAVVVDAKCKHVLTELTF